MMERPLISLALAVLFAAPLGAQDGAWLHISVRDTRRDGSEVRINLPAAVVVRAAPLLPETARGGCRLVVGDESMTGRDLSSILIALREAPPETGTRRDTGDLIVHARRSGQSVQLVMEEKFGRDTIAATIPIAVADELAGGGRRLDFVRAVRHLARTGGGELATITGSGSRVRIWVDGTPHQE
jgi:hypothetical protein